MKIEYYSTAFIRGDLAEASDLGTTKDSRYDLWLLGSYFGLQDPPCRPLHAATAEQAYAELNTEMPETPFQLHVPRGLRGIVARQARRPELAADEPSRLAKPYWTDRWAHLVDLRERAASLGHEQRMRLGTLLCALNFDQAALDVLPEIAVQDAGTSRLAAAAAMKRAHVIKRATGDAEARETDKAILSAIADSACLGPETRLGAALTMVVLSAREARDVEAVRRWRAVADQHLRQLSGDNWRHLLLTSMYWRAVSFLPFLLNDHRTVRDELDRAEQAARDMPDGNAAELLARRQNLHPLLETRARAAAAAGDGDMAIGFAAEAAKNDPYDGKVHITLGDLLRRGSDGQAAVAAYQRAVDLGAPYAARAQYLIAGCREAVGDYEAALEAYLHVVSFDTGAYSAVKAARRVAAELGRTDILRWSQEWVTGARNAVSGTR
jgi:tetratricopeptide (TPR) repeat protein